MIRKTSLLLALLLALCAAFPAQAAEAADIRGYSRTAGYATARGFFFHKRDLSRFFLVLKPPKAML